MFTFQVYKTTIWGNKPDMIIRFKTHDIKIGMKRAAKLMQQYIRIGVVNDYTSFTDTILSIGEKNWHVWDDAKTLVWDSTI